MSMKKLFISQPMRGKTDEEILKERKVLIADVYMKTHEEIEVIESFFEGAPADATPLVSGRKHQAAGHRRLCGVCPRLAGLSRMPH